MFLDAQMDAETHLQEEQDDAEVPKMVRDDNLDTPPRLGRTHRS